MTHPPSDPDGSPSLDQPSLPGVQPVDASPEPAPALVVPPTPARAGGGWPSIPAPFVVVIALIAFLGGLVTDRAFVGFGSVDLGTGAAAPTPLVPGSASPAPAPRGDDAFALIRESWDLLHKEYVGRDDLDDQAMAHAAIDALAESVGDEGHTTFLSPEALEEATESLAGEYVGIGTIVDEGESGLRIEGVFPDSPADEAGIGVGDEIVAVDGVGVEDSSVGEIADLIRGPEGTSVRLTIDPAGPPGPEDVTLIRKSVTIPVVEWAMVPDSTIAHVRLYQFSNGAIEKLMDALRAARDAGATRLVLDLRSNPGGFVDQAIGVASQFLSEGTVFITEDADGERTPSPVRGEGVATDLPLTILVDRSTASAAEIVASSIQEQRDVQVVGEQTFGTGTVLNRFGLKDGSALEIGVQRWLTPSGRALWHEGLTPDRVVTLAEGVQPVSPRDLEDLGAVGLRSSGDAQLLAALADQGWE